MSEENKALLRRWFEEVWNKGRSDAIDEMFAEEGVAHGLADASGAELRGPAHFREFHRSFRDAFPDICVTVEDVIAEGDLVTGRCSVCGVHRGAGLGFDATERPVEFTGISIVRVRDGKIVEAWNNFDFLAMFQQLGAVQTVQPAAPAPYGGPLPSTD
ncbi:MAG TPA: ester cyclase [Pyrinomonadaceae bacterium]|nr:ester cyclase [Pyrinomonadaceae bacterium]